MPTPLYDALRSYAGGNPLRMHMPGHKGKPLAAPEFAALTALDLTEISPTGDLYEAGEPFSSAQQLWAEALGFESCQFLTGGSTQGVHTALSLCCPPGSAVLLDRGCHRSAFHAIALLDLRPAYLDRPWLSAEGCAGPFDPEQVGDVLKKYPEVKTVCITSPTYCGMLSDIPAIAQAVHAHGGRLIVDGAHGAHLKFLGIDAFTGADAVVVSAHKTLPALGQSALLFTNGFDPELVRSRTALYGTSSPSYPILASLDLARDYMEHEGGPEYRRVARRAAELWKAFPSLGETLLRSKGIDCGRPCVFSQGLPLDPCRLTVWARDGRLLARKLEERGVFAEMADCRSVIFILTCADSSADLDRLEAALRAYAGFLGDSGDPLPPPPIPEQVVSIRKALFSPWELLPLERSLNKIAAGPVAPYPPGVPVVAPGERIGKKELAYLQKIGYNNRIVKVIAE